MIPLKYMDRRSEGDGTLRQCQLVQLHLLHVFDRICRDNNLTYYLIEGTLLGAIRHGGFIPWDDDLDVGMPVKEYKKFIRLAKQQLPNDVILHTRENVPGRMTPFAKLRDAYSLFCEPTASASFGVQSGIFIDIFPQYDIPRLGVTIERVLVKICKRSWRLARGLRTSGRRGMFFALFGGWLSLPFYALNASLHFLFWGLNFIFPAKRVYQDIDFMSFAFIEKDSLYPLVKHRFEDDDFPVPQCSERLLSTRYGDWKALPPESERKGGHRGLILPFDTLDVEGAMRWR